MCRVAAANVVADGRDVVYRPLVRWAGGGRVLDRASATADHLNLCVAPAL